MSIRPIAVGAVVIAALSFSSGWLAQGWRKDEQIASLERAQAVAVAMAYEQVREIEKRQQAAMEVIRHDATLHIMEVQTDADTANHTAERLHKELARYRTNAASACTATGSPSAQDSIGVLIGVLEGLESAGREIAEYADRARVAGSACERAYDSLRNEKKPRDN